MKIIDDPIEVQSNGVTQSVAFGIKSTGLPHIFNVLRNQLYSDKVLAVIREYSANAIDANKQAGKGDTPIEVTLPSAVNPIFSVRDFGPALNDEEIREVYAMYGESTKRNTNEQIGMLGLGSKSAFAYGDSFVINSYINGVKHSHTAFIDETKVGQISKLGEMETDQEDGVEIVISVRNDDCERFATKAINLFKHFEVKPVIHGLTDHELDGLNDEILFEGDDWKYLKESGNHPIAIMGGIPYEWDIYDLDLESDDPARSICNDHLILNFKIGELSITASREALEMTDATKKALVTKIKKVNKELKQKVEEKFNGCETMFDAKSLMGEICDYGSELYELSNWAKENLTYNGSEITSGRYNFYQYRNVNIRELKKTRGGNLRFKQTTTIDCRDKVAVVKNDIGHFRLALGKIIKLQEEEEGRKVYLITFDKPVKNSDEKTEKQICKELSFDAKTISLDSLPKPPKKSYASVQGRIVQKTFLYDDSGYRWGKWRDRWQAVELDIEEDEGVYVVINRYKIQKPNDYPYNEPNDFSNQMAEAKDALEKYQIEIPKKIYGFTKAESKKLKDNPNWVELHSYMSEQLEDVFEQEDYSELKRIASQCEDAKRDWFLNEYRGDVKDLALAEEWLGAEHPYVSVQNQYNQSKHTTTKMNNLESQARGWGYKLPKVEKKDDTLKKLADKVERDYPLVEHVDTRSYYQRENGKALKALLGYMRTLDKC